MTAGQPLGKQQIGNDSLGNDAGSSRRFSRRPISSRRVTTMRGFLGRLGYGALFGVLVPAALAGWARRLDALGALPSLRAVAAGRVLVAAGLLLAAWATLALRLHGGGLPMSAFPPERWVARGPYALLRHPLYVGAVLIAAGLSLAFGSAAGLWIVTPFTAALASMWVLGFERTHTRSRFGPQPPPALHLAPAEETAPNTGERLHAFTHLLLPWLLLYLAVERLGPPPDGIEAWMRWDAALPVRPWAEIPYVLTYPMVVLAPLVAPARRDLRWFVTRGWIAIAVIVPLWLLLPFVATAKPAPDGGLLTALMRLERSGDGPATALPAFHAAWAVIAAPVYARRWPSLGWLWWVLVALIAWSCVATGMHAALDVAAGLGAAALVLRAERAWDAVRAWAERVANSWREATLGPVRFLSHSVWAAAGAWCGLALFLMTAGRANLWPGLALTAVSIVGAALWAQAIEGSPQLLRPYGYYGAALSAVAGFVIADLLGADGWLLAGGFAVGGSVTQALGRGRCLVQGCCHGAACDERIGIRFTHARSRVTRLSNLGGVPLHPTQLYSMGWMLLVAAALLRLWTLRAPLPFIVGAYFVLVGLGRFVEEHLRGEPQTAVRWGLRVYQWLAILFVVAGAAVMTVPGAPAPPLSLPVPSDLLAVTGFAVLAYAAYGVDFPRLNARFSRLV